MSDVFDDVLMRETVTMKICAVCRFVKHDDWRGVSENQLRIP